MTDPTDHYLILSDLTLKNAQLLYPIAIFASKSIEQVKNATSTKKTYTNHVLCALEWHSGNITQTQNRHKISEKLHGLQKKAK